MKTIMQIYLLNPPPPSSIFIDPQDWTCKTYHEGFNPISLAHIIIIRPMKHHSKLH